MINMDKAKIEICRLIRGRVPTQAMNKLLKTWDVLEDGYSQRWGKLGILPRCLHQTPYWMLLNMGYSFQRQAYVCGHYYEVGVNKILREELNFGDTFVDIGANIGFHTLHAAYLVGDKGRCYAIEPVKQNFNLLQAHIDLNRVKNTEVFNVAFGSRQGETIIHDALGENVGSNSRPSQVSDRSCKVVLDKGDNVLRSIDAGAKGLCKIDTEGFEMQVLRGMSSFVESHPHFNYCVEITDEWLKLFEDSAEEVFRFFRQNGFSSYKVESSHLEPITKPLGIFQYDVLFARNLRNLG